MNEFYSVVVAIRIGLSFHLWAKSTGIKYWLTLPLSIWQRIIKGMYSWNESWHSSRWTTRGKEEWNNKPSIDKKQGLLSPYRYCGTGKDPL